MRELGCAEQDERRQAQRRQRHRAPLGEAVRQQEGAGHGCGRQEQKRRDAAEGVEEEDGRGRGQRGGSEIHRVEPSGAPAMSPEEQRQDGSAKGEGREREQHDRERAAARQDEAAPGSDHEQENGKAQGRRQRQRELGQAFVLAIVVRNALRGEAAEAEPRHGAADHQEHVGRPEDDREDAREDDLVGQQACGHEGDGREDGLRQRDGRRLRLGHAADRTGGRCLEARLGALPGSPAHHMT